MEILSSQMFEEKLIDIWCVCIVLQYLLFFSWSWFWNCYSSLLGRPLSTPFPKWTSLRITESLPKVRRKVRGQMI